MHIDTCKQNKTLIFAVTKKNKGNRRNSKNWSLTLMSYPPLPYSLWNWRDSSMLRALAALPVDLGWIPATYVSTQNCL